MKTNRLLILAAAAVLVAGVSLVLRHFLTPRHGPIDRDAYERLISVKGELVRLNCNGSTSAVLRGGLTGPEVRAILGEPDEAAPPEEGVLDEYHHGSGYGIRVKYREGRATSADYYPYSPSPSLLNRRRVRPAALHHVPAVLRTPPLPGAHKASACR